MTTTSPRADAPDFPAVELNTLHKLMVRWGRLVNDLESLEDHTPSEVLDAAGIDPLTIGNMKDVAADVIAMLAREYGPLAARMAD